MPWRPSGRNPWRCPDVDHSVEQRTSAQPEPPRQVETGAVHALLRGALESPVEMAVADEDAIADRHPGEQAAAVSARLDEKHPGGRILAQAGGQDATGRSASGDDVIVFGRSGGNAHAPCLDRVRGSGIRGSRHRSFQPCCAYRPDRAWRIRRQGPGRPPPQAAGAFSRQPCCNPASSPRTGSCQPDWRCPGPRCRERCREPVRIWPGPAHGRCGEGWTGRRKAASREIPKWPRPGRTANRRTGCPPAPHRSRQAGQLVGRVVGEEVGHLCIRKLGPADFVDRLAPQLSGDEDIGLVDGDCPPRSPSRDLESDSGETPYLPVRVFVQVVGPPLSRCGRVHSSGAGEHRACAQFAHHDDVGAVHPFGKIRDPVDQRVPGAGMADARERVEFVAKLHQAVLVLRPALDHDVAPFGPPTAPTGRASDRLARSSVSGRIRTP